MTSDVSRLFMGTSVGHRIMDGCAFARSHLPALSMAAAERGRYPCKLFHLAEIARREKPRRDHPRPADASHIGQREIISGLLRVDTAGRAENQIGQGAREGGEIPCPASRLGRKEFQRVKTTFP